MTDLIKNKVRELLENQTVSRVLGWKTGEFFYDETPAVFNSVEELEELVYDGFSAPNLSKYLIKESRKEGKIAVLLKPCDSYSFNQLQKEHRFNRDNVYAVGIPCRGKLDIEKIKALGIKGIQSIKEEGNQLVIETLYGTKTVEREEVLLDRCYCCKGSKHVAADEVIECDLPEREPQDRFDRVAKLEAMTAVCSVGLDMIVIPGETPVETISAIIADEAAIGMINSKTTAVRVIPAIGVAEGEELDFGGLLGNGPVMKLRPQSSAKMINRGGRIPAPMQSLKN